MTVQLYLAYVAACVVLVIVPGPTVTLIVANSLRHGTRAGLLNIAGTQLGLALMIGIVLAGLASLIAAMGWWFVWVRIAGAAYLVWLGIKLLRSSGSLAAPQEAPTPRVGFFWQGFLVLMSNPKALILFGALFPQFIDPQSDYVRQVLLLGVTAMATAFVFDSLYAILAGKAAGLLLRRHVRLVSRASGLCLIGGGAWLALTRTR
ncbi:MAG TPA: LysE family translocator [Xanthobacteraceae bacterium]|nr:LysE family translocator [Xanthobacteraceae bacterium]